jgi:ribosome-associated protein
MPAALKEELKIAAEAARSKKAIDVVGLDVKDVCSFTDYFLICSGANQPQVQAITDEIESRLKKGGWRPHHIEGYQQAEWILMDYMDFVVHIFSEKARAFYDLERLWRTAHRLTLPDQAR